jgi:CheY-like chemotaxis protein
MTHSNRPILLIEDNPMDVDLTRRAFARQQMANPIDVARDGEEALAFVKGWDTGESIPALILLDLKLPKLNGLEVLKALKTNPKYVSIPVVVLTSSTEDSDIQSAYRSGANSYIVKPVDFDKFMDVAHHIQHYWMIINLLPN